jgi:predicted transcriptional regulator
LANPKPGTSTTTIKLPGTLRTRIAKLARKKGRTPHGFMVEAIERETTRQERMESFVREAEAADGVIDTTGEVYAARDVHQWLGRLARDRTAPPPKRWRG